MTGWTLLPSITLDLAGESKMTSIFGVNNASNSKYWCRTTEPILLDVYIFVATDLAKIRCWKTGMLFINTSFQIRLLIKWNGNWCSWFISNLFESILHWFFAWLHHSDAMNSIISFIHLHEDSLTEYYVCVCILGFFVSCRVGSYRVHSLPISFISFVFRQIIHLFTYFRWCALVFPSNNKIQRRIVYIFK